MGVHGVVTASGTACGRRRLVSSNVLVCLERRQHDVEDPEENEEAGAEECTQTRSAEFALSEEGEVPPQHQERNAADGRGTVDAHAESQRFRRYIERNSLQSRPPRF